MTYTQPVFPALLVVALLGAWFGLRRGNRRAMRLAVAGVIGILLWSLPPVHWLAVWPIERLYEPLPAEAATAQAIVVLGGGVYSGEPHQPRKLQASHKTYLRCLHAARLYATLRGRPVVVTGGGGEAEVMADLLMALGVPRDRIVLERRARNTWQNARFSARLLKERGWHRIVLVTQVYHMPRAARAFRRQGLSVIPAACDFVTASPLWHELLPDGTTIRRNEWLAHELIGALWYELRAWLE